VAIDCWLLVKSQVPKAKSFSTKFLPEPINASIIIRMLNALISCPKLNHSTPIQETLEAHERI